jgi:hypothetical protein
MTRSTATRAHAVRLAVVCEHHAALLILFACSRHALTMPSLES